MQKKNKQNSVISAVTGDIINSKKVKSETWLKLIKPEFDKMGKSPKHWEIFRGDSFQVRIDDPLLAFETVVKLKAILKSLKPLDVRVAIGIGTINHDAARITEANGTAFIHSGEMFELLNKQKQSIAVKSDWKTFDETFNLHLKLALIAMDNWTVNSANIVKLAMENPEKSQDELGQLLGIKQNTVSRRLKRAYFDELMELNAWYKSTLKLLL